MYCGVKRSVKDLDTDFIRVNPVPKPQQRVWQKSLKLGTDETHIKKKYENPKCTSSFSLCVVLKHVKKKGIEVSKINS